MLSIIRVAMSGVFGGFSVMMNVNTNELRRESRRLPPLVSLSSVARINLGAKLMAKSESKHDYSNAMALIDKNLRSINRHSDPIAWNWNTALGLLVRGIQQDTEELRERLASIDSKLSNLKQQTPLQR